MATDRGVRTISAATRLSPPRLGRGTIDRPRLVERIARSDTIVFVDGGAGSGKSTVLAQAFAALPESAWLSLDPGDNDPTRLWSAITDAISEVIPDFGSTYRKRLTTQQPRVVEDIVPAAINELVDSGRVVRLFLDDLQLVSSTESLHSIKVFLDRCPSSVGVVIASRASSPLPLQRYRLDGRLVEIGPADLAADPNEAAAMLSAAGLQLDRAQGDQLHALLEGWVAGLRWAAMALDDEPDFDRFLSSATSPDSDIAKYVVEEVLDRLPDEHRRFMLETSILHRLSGQLCDEVRNRTDSGVLLEQLERSNALLTATERKDGWYRYHHLGREILAARLRREAPDIVANLHRRAARWSIENAEVRDAIEHLLEAGDRTDAANILCANWWELMNAGQIRTAMLLLEHFEPSEIHGYQPLAAAASLLCGVGGDAARSRAFYTSALDGDFEGAPPDGAASMASTLAILRGALALDGVGQVLRDGELARSLEPAGSPWRPLAALLAGLGHTWTGDSAGAAPYFEEVIVAGTSDQAAIVYAMTELAVGRLESGDPLLARATAEDACAFARDAGVEMLVPTAIAHAAAALAHLALDDHVAAANHVDAGEAPLQALEDGLPVDAMRAKLLLADASLQLGRLHTAETYLDEASETERLIVDTGALGDRLTDLRNRLREIKAVATPDFGLTDREIDVLQLLATDLTRREIAAKLYLSRNTVKTYQSRLYRQLGVSTREDAVVVARRAKLIPERQLDS